MPLLMMTLRYVVTFHMIILRLSMSVAQLSESEMLATVFKGSEIQFLAEVFKILNISWLLTAHRAVKIGV